MKAGVKLSITSILFILSVYCICILSCSSDKKSEEDITYTMELSQYGITWYFDKEYEYGQFANGDWWIIGPVTIVQIAPASIISDGRTINGSQINPIPGDYTQPSISEIQGYDSRGHYNASLNAARPGGADLSEDNPLVLQPGTSLISAISHPSPDPPVVRTLTDASVLTVLSSAPPEGSFRPPYCGDDKVIIANKEDLDYSILLNLEPVESTPLLSVVEQYIERVWVDHTPNWTKEYWAPSNNGPVYGRDVSRRLGDAILSLMLDYTKEQKETLYIRLVQLGIDYYGAAKNGMVWLDQAGHNGGRKIALLFAGLALSNDDILEYADAEQHFIFQEDRQTWYVTDDDVGRPLYHDDGRTREEYIESDVGIAEWGETHTYHPQYDGRNWDITYRALVSRSNIGPALCAYMLNAKDIWNWPAFFDYCDRYMSVEAPDYTNWHVSGTNFALNMWKEYRDDF